MKKIVYFLIICFCFVSCKKSEEKIAEIDKTTIMNEIVDDVIQRLKYSLKDPSSLKISDFWCFYELKNKDIADKYTWDYAHVQELKELKKEGHDWIREEDLVYNSPFFNAYSVNTRFFIFTVVFYGKNSFGAYSGNDKKSFIAEVKEDGTNLDGTHNYWVTLYSAADNVIFLPDDETLPFIGYPEVKLKKLIPNEYKF